MKKWRWFAVGLFLLLGFIIYMSIDLSPTNAEIAAFKCDVRENGPLAEEDVVVVSDSKWYAIPDEEPIFRIKRSITFRNDGEYKIRYYLSFFPKDEPGNDKEDRSETLSL